MEEWVKLHTTYYTDAKVEALPDADTELMFVRGLARAGELRRAGFIPEESLPKLARRRRYAASVEALLAAGLWTKVAGGYRITNWDHWQDSLDALARRRAADRERQRRRRASAAESTAESDASRDKEGMSRDSRSRDHDLGDQSCDGDLSDVPTGSAAPPAQTEMSRDMSRDVTDTEREGEREGVKVGDIAHPYACETSPPPSKCPQHLDDPNPPACGPCGDARKARNRWEVEQGKRDRETPKCQQHRGQYAHNCAICRSEKIGAA